MRTAAHSGGKVVALRVSEARFEDTGPAPDSVRRLSQTQSDDGVRPGRTG